jgi:hypothetical protein
MSRKTFEGVGYTALGLGFLFQAAKAWGLFGLADEPAPGRVFNGARTNGLRGLAGPESEAMQRAGGVITKVTTRTIGDIRERVAYIQERVRKDSLKPEIREKALAVLTRKCETKDGKKWCVPEKDYEAEIRALFTAVRDANSDLALRYTRDHIQVDQYHSANKLLKLKGGDCDDGTILLGSMLRAVGYPVRLRVIQDVNSASWSHIYLLVGIPPMGPTKWIALDWSVPGKAPGWEAPGAKSVALNGKPAGVVKKLMDFKV